MKTKIELDLKSLALGATAAAVIILGSGATSPAGYPGKFQVVAAGSDGKVVEVNTETGQCWTAVINSNGLATGTSGSNTFLTPKLN